MGMPAAVANPNFAALHTNRFFTGLWTQRNPLRDAATPFAQEQAGARRMDSLIDGSNGELTARLTLARRAGHSVYNSQVFPAINRFYGFRIFGTASETIRLVVDCATEVYDGTGPNGKTLILTKAAGAGRACFQSVGNTLYLGDGAEEKKWVQTARVWVAATSFAAGAFIVDSNNRLQVPVGAQSVTIATVEVNGANVCTVTFDQTVPLFWVVGVRITFSGLTTATFLNGNTYVVTSVSAAGTQVTFALVHAVYAAASDTGTAATTAGNTAGVQPAWGTTLDAVTLDGGTQWVCRGSAMQKWGVAAPASAPNVANVSAPTAYNNWVALTFYNPSNIIIDSNGSLQELTTGGTTGGVAPAWAVIEGNTTADNTAVWTHRGTGVRANLTAYAVGKFIKVTQTSTVRVPLPLDPNDPEGDRFETITTTVSGIYQCTVAGVTAAISPSFPDGIGSTVTDGTVTWTNVDQQITWPTIGAATLVSKDQTVLDSNLGKQAISSPGKTGAAPPTWKTVLGQTTVDGTANWTFQGSYGAANSGAWIYGYAEKNSLTGEVSSMSPASTSITLAAGKMIAITGKSSTDDQTDLIQIYRTAQNGSTELLLTEITKPRGGVDWAFYDLLADINLSVTTQARIEGLSDPPPSGSTNLCYHLGRMFTSVGNTVWYSDSSVTNGAPNSCFPPTNYFVFPSMVVRMWSSSIGLMVFTTSHIYIILGRGISGSGFYAVTFIEGTGMLGYDAFAVHGSTVYLMTNAKKVLGFDPGAGILEVGFPIGDQFKDLYDASAAYLTWHEGDSADSALYVADGAAHWFRMSPNPAPERGAVWSPKATVTGTKAVQSVEVAPGLRKLLVGPAGAGPIWQRDTSVNTDAGTQFTWYGSIGNINLAYHGRVAGIEFIGVDSVKVGSRAVVSLLLDEISGTFDDLYADTNDPPLLPPSETLYAERYNCDQAGSPTFCRHFQIKFSYPAEDAHNELLAYTVFGAMYQEK